MSRYGKRRRTEPESDDDLDDDEKEALRAFQEEGFNEDLVNTEEARKKKAHRSAIDIQPPCDHDRSAVQVEEDLDRKQKESDEDKKSCGFAHGGEDMRAQQARLQQMGIPMGMPPPGAPGWPGMQMPGMMQMPPGMMPGYGMPPGQMMPGYMMQGAPQPQVYHHQAQLPPGYVHVPQFPGMMAPATGGAMLPVAGVVVSSTQPPGLGAANSIGGPPPPPPPR